MLSMIIMIFGHFMTVYRLLVVFRKGYATLCDAYGSFRPELIKAVDDPDQIWDNTLMDIMDKIFKYK